ncbi:LOW QUALITY PROTEIN: diphosphomevalonate decarboxylase [Acipenser ruthenus]|uniref:LOW QUALITY PROTEIN: diphosphomevalonate decarboxylase n=1 Tax=Acipenser ruthenus TaxID=7906 RepID=UPI0027422AE0|nr:LOW QUALITY PROTEIN: diphosphomevalonate decarboxylase [Acipenser ruthenus]
MSSFSNVHMLAGNRILHLWTIFTSIATLFHHHLNGNFFVASMIFKAVEACACVDGGGVKCKAGLMLKTTTTVASSQLFKEDRIWLNGKEDNINHPWLQSCLREIRRLARKRSSDGDNNSEKLNLSHKVHICFINNFPTAAGLTSFAAGYACLVYTLARLCGVEGELSEVAHQGSGSACRSMYGGFVQWIMGDKPDGKDSIAERIQPDTHWPELRVLILVVSAEWKPVGSTAGMQTSVQTSPLLKYRAESVVPERMKEMIAAIRWRDFETLGELTMNDHGW